MADAPQGDAGGLAEWMTLSEALLRGLVHALNNRLTALSAFAELSALGDEEYASPNVLPAELARLHQVGALFRLLVTEHEAAEAMELGPLLDDAVALHVHHPRLRAVRCDVERSGPSMPVRVPRWAMLRLLLVLMESGKRAADEAGRDVTVLHVNGDDDWVLLHADGDTLSPYTSEMVAACGATAERQASGWVVRIPSLVELRRRERAGRDAARP